jgi:molybdopterin/thiamine biosynthesis adenylyltransferase
MNRAAVRLNKPLIDCAMYDLTGQIITVLPRRSACLACLYAEAPPAWQQSIPCLWSGFRNGRLSGRSRSDQVIDRAR